MELAARLRQIRIDNNLTQQELADTLCVSRSVVTKYENGYRVPDLDTLNLISSHFKTNLFNKYKNRFILFILSIRCIIPYLISLTLMLVSCISLVANIIKVNNEYGYNIYNDELKVKNSEDILIIKKVYSHHNINEINKYISIKMLHKSKINNTDLYLSSSCMIVNDNTYYLVFIDIKQNNVNGDVHYQSEYIIRYKPFIYSLEDYDESLPYDKQNGKCSKILNYYIDLIEKTK